MESFLRVYYVVLMYVIVFHHRRCGLVTSVVYSLSGSRLTRFELGGAARAALHSAQLRFTLT